MARLVIAVPGEPERRTVEFDAGEGVLLGREPDPARLKGEAALFHPVALKPIALHSPSVSSNHLAAWADDHGGLSLVDVGSRHGTFVKLPPHQPVDLASTQLVEVALADASTADCGVPPTGPSSATWKDRSDFAAATAGALQSWLASLGLSARITHHPARPRDDPPDHPGRLPLASGDELSVVPQQTMDARWRTVLQQVWRYVQRENERFDSEEAARTDGLVIASEAIRLVHRQVVEAARRGARLLLVGPSGVGKEGLARVYHRHTGRTGPFVPRNCAMLTKELVRAELFGAEAGAFTGATRRIVGAVERANGGTLFLDELGEMAAEVQPMLLRFLDRGEFERLGDYGTTRMADVRIVAATNKDLREALERSEFRNDLWYRLSNELVEVPPLRERPEDLLEYLRRRCLPDGTASLDLLLPEARERVLEHDWAGNFRELEQFAERLAAEVGAPVDAKRCEALLLRGSLRPLSAETAGPPRSQPTPSPVALQGAWRDLVDLAASAFEEDFGHDTPGTWDEVKEFIEKYFKPLLFVRLGAGPGTTPTDSDGRRLAQRMAADRGTATKQLGRYLERFTRQGVGVRDR